MCVSNKQTNKLFPMYTKYNVVQTKKHTEELLLHLSKPYLFFSKKTQLILLWKLERHTDWNLIFQYIIYLHSQ